jgi:hypothetical protein
MADFDDIETELKCHFCPQCGSSFECRDEDGDCQCPGVEFAYDPPFCDECTEARKAEEKAEAEEAEEVEDETEDEDDETEDDENEDD